MMWKTLGLAVALMTASIVPALADSACMEPIAPAAIDGGAATKAQMTAAHADVVTFLKQSDDYQVCLLRELTEEKAAAVKAKKDFDASIEAGVSAKVVANQNLKEKVGGEYNAAVIAYKAKNPG